MSARDVHCPICSIRAGVAGRDGRPRMGRGCQLFGEMLQSADSGLVLAFVGLADERSVIKRRGGRYVRIDS